MKKILLLLLAITFNLSQGQTYTINSQLRLNTVHQGNNSDSILVRGSDKIIKYITRSELLGSSLISNLQQVTTSGNTTSNGIVINDSYLSVANSSEITDQRIVIGVDGINFIPSSIEYGGKLQFPINSGEQKTWNLPDKNGTILLEESLNEKKIPVMLSGVGSPYINSQAVEFLNENLGKELIYYNISDSQLYIYDYTVSDWNPLSSAIPSLQNVIDQASSGNLTAAFPSGTLIDDDGSKFSLSQNTPDGQVYFGTSIFGFNFLNVDSAGLAVFEDTRSNPSGLEYQNDYSSTFVDRSLVDKNYVDTTINSLNLQKVFNNDNGYIYAESPSTEIEDDGGALFWTPLSGKMISIGANVSIAFDNGVTNDTYISDNRMITKGLEYLADYSSGYSSRSLVDKNYVDTKNMDNLKIISIPPVSSTATGTKGQIAFDSNYAYICTATNTWGRFPLTTTF